MAIGSHWWLAVPAQFADHWRTVGRSEGNLRQIPCCRDVCRSGNLRWQTDGLPCFLGDVGLAPKAKEKPSRPEVVRRQPIRVTDTALISSWPVSATQRKNRLFFRRKISPRKPTSYSCKSFTLVIFFRRKISLSRTTDFTSTTQATTRSSWSKAAVTPQWRSATFNST